MGRSIKVKEGKDQVLPSLKAITKSDLGDELVEHFGDMRRLMNTFMRLIDIRMSSQDTLHFSYCYGHGQAR